MFDAWRTRGLATFSMLLDKDVLLSILGQSDGEVCNICRREIALLGPLRDVESPSDPLHEISNNTSLASRHNILAIANM